MKLRNKLEAVYSYDFDLIGLVSATKEYKLAWYLNQKSDLHLVKAEDIKIEFKNNSQILISNFVFESEFINVLLLSNKLLSSNSTINKFLVAELKQFDYLIQIKSELDDSLKQALLDIVRALPVVTYASIIDIEKLKNKENLLF